MNRKAVLIVTVIILAIIGLAWFQYANRPTVRMNNYACPYSGEPVNEKDTYIHKGKEYRLCDEKCKQPLSENPDKYLCD